MGIESEKPLLEQLHQRQEEINEEDNLLHQFSSNSTSEFPKDNSEKNLSRRLVIGSGIVLVGAGLGIGGVLTKKVLNESSPFSSEPQSTEHSNYSLSQASPEASAQSSEVPMYNQDGFRISFAAPALENYFGNSSGSVVIENTGVTITPATRIDYESMIDPESNLQVGKLRYSKRVVQEIDNPNDEVNLEILALPLGDVYLTFKNPADPLANHPIPLEINAEQELRDYTDSLTHLDKDAIDVVVDKRLTSGDSVLHDLAGETSIFNYAKAGIKTVVIAENARDIDITFDDGRSGILVDRDLAEEINAHSNEGLKALGHKASTFILQKNRSNLDVSSSIADFDTLFIEIKNNFQKRIENLEIYGDNGPLSEYNVVSIFNMFANLNIDTAFPVVDDLFADVVTTLRYNPAQFIESYSNHDNTKGFVLTNEEKKRVNQILSLTFTILTQLTDNKDDKSLSVLFPKIQHIRTATGLMSDQQEEDLQDFLRHD